MKITFDFDGTLEDEFGLVSLNSQKDEIQNLAKAYILAGHDVRILTRRFDSRNSDKGIKNEHLDVYRMSKKLGITEDKVHFY